MSYKKTKKKRVVRCTKTKEKKIVIRETFNTAHNVWEIYQVYFTL